MVKTSSPVTICPRRAKPVLVCKKCLKRIDAGSKLKRALKSELKRRSIAHATRRPRIVMTGCFGICPKRAVVAASGATLQRGEYILLADANSSVKAAALLVPAEDVQV
jgi:predicted metal-binding protein